MGRNGIGFPGNLISMAGGIQRKIRHWLHQKNAGILFYYDSPEGRQVLLLKRSHGPGKGLWGGSGGGADPSDGTLWHTAIRETLEEMGDHDAFRVARAVATEPEYWHVSGLYHFRIYLLQLMEKPSLQLWPSQNRLHARDCHEWTEARWFPLGDLPPVWQRLPGLWLLADRLAPGRRSN